MKKTLALILALVLSLSLVACGGESGTVSDDSPSLSQSATGRYEIEKIAWDDGTEATGDILTAMGECYIEIYSDNTALLCLYGQMAEMEFSEDQIWRADNSAFIYGFSVKDGKATLVDDGTTFVFVKK